jgi:hypothetical protein
MSAMSRRKGARAENALANLLAELLGIPVSRQLGQERDGGADLHIGKARIQVKRCEKLEIQKWWEQAVRDAGEYVPVLAYRQSRKPWTFRVPLDVLIGSMPEFGYVCELGIDEFCYVAREVLL